MGDPMMYQERQRKITAEALRVAKDAAAKATSAEFDSLVAKNEANTAWSVYLSERSRQQTFDGLDS